MAEELLATRSQVSPQVSSSDQDIIVAAKGGGIAFAGNLIDFAIRFVFGIVVARLLGAKGLGLYSLGTMIPEILAASALLGLSVGMARYIPIAVSQKDTPRLWGTIQVGIALPLLICVPLTIGVFLSADFLSQRLFSNPELAPVLRLASLGIPLLALIAILSSITQGFKRMEYKVYAEDICNNVVKLIITVVLIAAGLSVTGAITAQIVALAATVALSFYFVNRLFSFKRPLHLARRNVREMLRFTLPLYLSQLISLFSGSIETLVLGIVGVMSGVGIYTAALRLSSIGALFHQALQRIAIPMISDLYSQGRLDSLKRLYQTLTKWGMTFNLPVFLTVAVFARPLLAIFGVEFVAGSTGLVILAFGVLYNAMTGVCGSVVTMTGHSRLTAANSFISLAVSLGLDLFLIPRWGIVGAALAVMLSTIIINTLRMCQVYILLRMWPYNLSFLKPIAAALAAAVAGQLVNQRLAFVPELLQVILGAMALWIVYALVIVCLGLSKEDRLILDRLWERLRVRRLPG